MCVYDTARDVPCGRGLSIGAVALMVVSHQAALVWGREREMERSRVMAKSMQM